MTRREEVERLRIKYRPERWSLAAYDASTNLLECPLTGLRFTDVVRSTPDGILLFRGGEILTDDPVVVEDALRILAGVWTSAIATHCGLCHGPLDWTDPGVDEPWLDRPSEISGRALFHMGCAMDYEYETDLDARFDAMIEAGDLRDAETY